MHIAITTIFVPNKKQSAKLPLQRGRDSNPRYAFDVYTLSRRAPSTTRPPLCNFFITGGQITKKTLNPETLFVNFKTFPLAKNFQI